MRHILYHGIVVVFAGIFLAVASHTFGWSEHEALVVAMALLTVMVWLGAPLYALTKMLEKGK